MLIEDVIRVCLNVLRVLRFHLQADLILTSGRESILESRPWNMWVQEEVGCIAADLLVSD